MVAPSSAISANSVDGGGAAPDDELTTEELDKEQLLARIKGWWREDDRNAGVWREQAKTDFAFEAGHQWSDDDRDTLDRECRPVITFNRIRPIVKVVRGLEINNREEVSIKPRGAGDEPAAECATNLIEWVRDEGDVEDEETDAFRDVIIAGMGWVEHRLDNIDEPRVVLERVDPFEVRWDARAKKRNLSDAKRVHRAREIALDDARAKHPGVRDEDLDAAWARGAESGRPIDRDRAERYEADSGKLGDEIRTRGAVTMVETQWEEVVTYRAVTLTQMSPMGEPVEQTEELREMEAITAAERALQMGIMARVGDPLPRRRVYRAVIGREVLTAGPLPIQGQGFWLKPLTGEWDREDKIFCGIVRDARDPQEWTNKWVSQIQHRLNSAVKKQTWFETGAFVDQRKAEQDMTRPGALIEFGEGALTSGRVMRQDESEMPDSTERLLQFAMSIMRDVTGINLEIMGLADRDQPGILEHQRKQASVTILADYFDNLRRFRKASASLTMEMTLKLLNPEQLQRAVGEDQQQGLQLLMQPGARNYDIVIEEAPTSANAKERAWAAISPLLPVLIERASPAIMAAIVRASPLPSQLAEKIAQELEQPPDPQKQQEAMQQAQLMMQGMAAQIQETEASAFQKQTTGQLNLAKIQGEQADAAAAIIQAQQPRIYQLPSRPASRLN